MNLTTEQIAALQPLVGTLCMGTALVVVVIGIFGGWDAIARIFSSRRKDSNGKQ